MKKTEQIPPALGTVLILLAGCSWGSIGIFVRNFNKAALGSMEIVALRSVFTVIFMGLFLLIRDRSLFKVKLKDLWCFVGTGVVSMAFFNFCYFRLITVSSLSIAAVMLYTAPVFVMLLSAVLFREKITGVKTAAVILTVVGCAFVTGIVGSPVHLTLSALLLGIGAGLGYALYSIFGRYAIMKGYHNFTIVFYTFVFTSIAVIPLSDMGRLASVVTSGAGMAVFSALCGIVTTVFPYIVYNFGLTAVENGKAAIIASVEPVVATLIGVFIFRETMTAGNLIGIAMVLSAIVLTNVRLGKEAPAGRAE